MAVVGAEVFAARSAAIQSSESNNDGRIKRTQPSLIRYVEKLQEWIKWLSCAGSTASTARGAPSAPVAARTWSSPTRKASSAAVRLPQGRLSVPLAIDPLGVASTATQCQWLCEQHQDGCR